jgi:phospholipase C
MNRYWKIFILAVFLLVRCAATARRFSSLPTGLAANPTQLLVTITSLWSGATKSPDAKTGIHLIQHVIIIMQENRSLKYER